MFQFGYRSSNTAESDVDAHQSWEIHLKLCHHRAGTRGPSIAGKSKKTLASARAVLMMESRWMGGTTTATADHNRTSRKAGCSFSVDDPQLAKLIAHEKAPLGPLGWALRRRYRRPAKCKASPRPR